MAVFQPIAMSRHGSQVKSSKTMRSSKPIAPCSHIPIYLKNTQSHKLNDDKKTNEQRNKKHKLVGQLQLDHRILMFNSSW